MVEYTWRGDIDNNALEQLHAEGFDHDVGEHDWQGQLSEHSLGWVTATDDGQLIGFVNVVWDGANHAFILDTLVARNHRRQGVGVELLRHAALGTKAAGCEWLHADFEEHLTDFYCDAGGFSSTSAGILDLSGFE